MATDLTTNKQRNQISGDGWSVEQIGNVGVFFWKADEGLGRRIVNVLQEIGCRTTILYNEDLKSLSETDNLLVYGPWGSLEPIAHHLKNLDPIMFTEDHSGNWTPRPRWLWLISKLHRYRYYGDIYRYCHAGLLDVVAVWSHWTAALLRERGIPAIKAYMGHSSANGRDLRLKRDIPVLWLGKRGSSRRSRLLNQIRTRLAARDIDMMVVDGVEHSYVFGEERTRLLNRSKIVLNLLRKPWDNNSMRFFLASANKTLVVSEPVLPHIPFKRDFHYIERPIQDIPRAIEYYLAHESEREAIADRAYQLGVEQLTMSSSLKKILHNAQR